MNVVTLGSRIRKNAGRLFDSYKRQCDELQVTCELTYDDFLNQQYQQRVADYVTGQTCVNMMKEKAQELGLLTGKPTRTFFITIRPDEKKITFDDFYLLTIKLMERKCFETYTLSFEQKGMNDDTLGTGFHVHIVAKCKQRSSTEVLRDVHSTMKKCTALNCIDVKVCHNPESVIAGYLTNYDSDDGHKAPTKEWDAKWRERMGLQHIYENVVPTVRVLPLT